MVTAAALCVAGSGSVREGSGTAVYVAVADVVGGGGGEADKVA